MYATLARELLDLLLADLRLETLITLVRLVRYHDNLHVRLAMLLNLGKPHAQVVKALFLKQIEAEDDALGSLVVGIGDGPVSLLAGRVPDLQLHFPVAVVDGAEAKVDSDRCRVVLDEVIICKPDEQARLADAGVTQQD